MHCILALWQNWDVVKLLWQLRNRWSDSTLKLIELRCWNFQLWNMEKVSGDPCQSLSWWKFNSSHVWHLCVLAWVRCPDWFDPRLEAPGQWRGKKCLADVFKKYEKSIETVSNCMEIGIIWSSMSLWFVAFTWCVIGDTGEYECFQFQCWRLSGVMTELAVGSETAGFRLVGKNLQIDSPHKAARIQRLRYSIKFIPELGALND